MVEMTAVRVLEPFFGSTAPVWSNVIAVVLASLAVGYAAGGRLADRRCSLGLLYGILAVGGVLLTASAVSARWFIAALPGSRAELEGMQSVLTKGSLAASIVLFAPITVLLGAATPLAVRLLARDGVGRATGRVLALSTTGAIVGVYLPTLWLVPALGSRGTLLVAAGLLLFVAVGGLLSSGRRRAALAVGVPLVGVALAVGLGQSAEVRSAPALLDGGTATVLEQVESPYQFLEVRRDRLADGTELEVLTASESVHGYQSVRVPGRVLTGARYYDDYALLPLLLDLAPGDELRCCIVGLAAGVHARQWRHFWGDRYELRVDGAEIDPEVVRLGRAHLGLPGPEERWLRVHEMDGRQLLVAAPAGQRWHLIVVDAFARSLYVPFHLATREFFETCRRRLEPGGILAMNVDARDADSPHLEALENTLATAFGRCLRIRQRTWGNFILLARAGSGPPDLARLARGRIRARLGERADVSEWPELVSRADWLPAHGVAVLPRPGVRVLTDDHAPIESLMDRDRRRFEAEVRR